MVARMQSEGNTNIQFADVNSVVDMTELRDGVHPNDDGYQDMGEYWSNLLIEYLSGEHIVSDTTTTSYDTEVTTFPQESTSTDSIISTTEVSVTDTTTETTTDNTTTITEITTDDTTTTTETTIDIIDDPVGDINHDGKVNYLDVLIVKRCILGIDSGYDIDVNNDGYSNIIDLVSLKRIILGVDIKLY